MSKTDKPHALSKLNFLVEEMDNKHVNIVHKFRYPYLCWGRNKMDVRKDWEGGHFGLGGERRPLRR